MQRMEVEGRSHQSHFHYDLSPYRMKNPQALTTWGFFIGGFRDFVDV
ncbi:MAG: hypothetical protein AAFX78_08185 [Cyanobacteria bacterium J06638_20]